MRTTLDLDDRVLVAARSRAHEEGKTLGATVSELALAGLDQHHELPTDDETGLIFFPSVPGHVITDEDVADALDEE